MPYIQPVHMRTPSIGGGAGAPVATPPSPLAQTPNLGYLHQQQPPTLLTASDPRIAGDDRLAMKFQRAMNMQNSIDELMLALCGKRKYVGGRRMRCLCIGSMGTIGSMVLSS